jgi:hypothetical protein
MKNDRSYSRSRRLETSRPRPEPPPTPSALIGQILGALAIFALLALILWWHAAPPCDAGLVGAGAPCAQRDGMGTEARPPLPE